jgi:hypothetical protein
LVVDHAFDQCLPHALGNAAVNLTFADHRVDHRAHIVDRDEDVQNDSMSPEAAEEEAARLGLPPLAPVPDPASYNPMCETGWTLVMAIAWILWRSPRKVCEFWDTYRRECWDWQLPRRAAGSPVQCILKQREPATLSRLILEAN